VAKKNNSVEESVAQFFAGNKKELSDDLFNTSTSSGLVNISLSRIVEDKNQPRKTFNSETIKELASSIKEQGIINPITVRPYGGKYVIIAGERRFLAARQAGLKVIPALVRDIIKSCGFRDSKGAYPPLKYYCLENIIRRICSWISVQKKQVLLKKKIVGQCLNKWPGKGHKRCFS
jgi:hypothetical protein